VRAHAKADELIQGTGWSGGKGCAIGCTLEDYDHERYPIELGVPVELARLEDQIFERLPKPDAMKWPAAILSAIPVGADLSLVWPRFALWTLHGLPAKSLTRSDVKTAVDAVAELYERWIAGEKPKTEEWRKARSAAADAAAAAYAAADAAAYAAADAAAARRWYRCRWYVRPYYVLWRMCRWDLFMNEPNLWRPLVDMYKLGCVPIGYVGNKFVVYVPECIKPRHYQTSARSGLEGQ
jgi:hypothetical protein